MALGAPTKATGAPGNAPVGSARRESRRCARRQLLATVVAAVFVLSVMRIVVNALPFRNRPPFEPQFTLVRDLQGGTITPPEMENSFPSDRAALFVCLATGLIFDSRRAGLLALAYVLLLICFPRMYVGFHYPTDILVGGLIGATGAMVTHLLAAHRTLRNKLDEACAWADARPELFYPCLLLLSFEIMELFNSVRSLMRVRGLAHALGIG